MSTMVTKRWRTKKGYLFLQEDECKGCAFCIEFCPKNVLQQSNRFNIKGYYPPEVVDADACVNCTFCQLICPDFAIWSVKDEEAEGSADG